MATAKIIAGDFPKGKASISVGWGTLNMTLPWQPEDGFSFGKLETFSPDEIEEITLASEDSVKRLGGTVGWGITGAALLGPVGLLAGLLLGGKGKETTFIVIFKDGRKLLATVDSKTYIKILGLKI